MVGAGQLARMTAQAAIGLGVGFRVLADSPDDSAAQVWAGTQLGRLPLRWLTCARSRPAATCSPSITSMCPAITWPRWSRPGVKVRPGAAALRLTQDKLVMRERLTGLGVACPRFAPVTGLAACRSSPAAPGRWC